MALVTSHSRWPGPGLSVLPGAAALVAVFLAAGCITVRERVVADPAPSAPAPSPAPVPVAEPDPPPPPPPPSVSEYEAELMPYGVWVVSGRWGRVWVPSTAVVGAGWRPYTAGHWVLTEYGWTWVDDQAWAYRVHHYGRWAWDPAYGWVWVPDTVWGPGWVVWRTGGMYVGWAPLPPGAAVGGTVYVSDGSWACVETRYMGYPGIYRRTLWGPHHHQCMTTTFIYRDVRRHHRHAYDHGPPPQYVDRGGGRSGRTPVADLDRTTPVFRPRPQTGSPPPPSGTGSHGPSVVEGRGRSPDSSTGGPGSGGPPAGGGHGPSDVTAGGPPAEGGSRGHGPDHVGGADGPGTPDQASRVDTSPQPPLERRPGERPEPVSPVTERIPAVSGADRDSGGPRTVAPPPELAREAPPAGLPPAADEPGTGRDDGAPRRDLAIPPARDARPDVGPGPVATPIPRAQPAEPVERTPPRYDPGATFRWSPPPQEPPRTRVYPPAAPVTENPPPSTFGGESQPGGWSRPADPSAPARSQPAPGAAPRWGTPSQPRATPLPGQPYTPPAQQAPPSARPAPAQSPSWRPAPSPAPSSPPPTYRQPSPGPSAGQRPPPSHMSRPPSSPPPQQQQPPPQSSTSSKPKTQVRKR